MFGFGRKKRNQETLKKQYDRKLLADIELAKDEFNNIRHNDDLLATMSTEELLEVSKLPGRSLNSFSAKQNTGK